MRILLVTHFFPPHHLGGTEVLTASLAQGLRAAGNDVQVICGENWDSAPSDVPHHTDELFDGIPVRRLHFNWQLAPDVFRYLYNNPEVEKHLTNFLRETRPDIVQITSCYTLSASVISAAHRLGIPIVLTATDFWFLCARNTLLQNNSSLCTGPETPWKCARCLLSDAAIYRMPRMLLPESMTTAIIKSIARHPGLTNRPGLRGMLGDWEDRFAFLSQALGKADRVVTASRFLRELFIQSGVAEEKIIFSAYGLDTTWARGFENKKKSSHFRIGFIGQLVPFKGADLLIRAATSLDPGLPVQVKIYGDLGKDPTHGRELQKLSANDPRISFLGTFDNSKMGEVLSEIDALAVPSTWYDFPLVIPSALATKTPVLATNLSGMNELIKHERNGLLFKRGDWGGLARQIQRLIDEPGLLGKLRMQIEPVKTVPQMADEYAAMYAALLHRDPSKSIRNIDFAAPPAPMAGHEFVSKQRQI